MMGRILLLLLMWTLVAWTRLTPKHPQCTVFENIVKTDSTYYEVDCGGKAKIKTIIETE